MRRAALWARRWGAWALAGILGLLCLVLWTARRRALPPGLAAPLARLRDAHERARAEETDIRRGRAEALDRARAERADTEREIVAAEASAVERLTTDHAARREVLDARLRELGLDPEEHRR